MRVSSLHRLYEGSFNSTLKHACCAWEKGQVGPENEKKKSVQSHKSWEANHLEGKGRYFSSSGCAAAGLSSSILPLFLARRKDISSGYFKYTERERRKSFSGSFSFVGFASSVWGEQNIFNLSNDIIRDAVGLKFKTQRFLFRRIIFGVLFYSDFFCVVSL